MRISVKALVAFGLLVAPMVVVVQAFSVLPIVQHTLRSKLPSTRLQETKTVSPETVSDDLAKALAACQDEVAKKCKVTVAPVANNRLGLVATQNINKGDVVLAMPYDDRLHLTPALAKNVIFKDLLPESFDNWTGDAGLIALLILNEVAVAAGAGAGVAVPNRPAAVQSLIEAWVQALPSLAEMKHPLMWPEQDQEVLQSSSTTKIYRLLDDLEEDAGWLTDNVFSADKDKFPATVTWNGESIDCFNLQGLKWALALAQSRTVFVDGSLRLIPVLDMCNHADDAGNEIKGGYMGTFGTVPGAQLIAAKKCMAGQEVFCSYGPKSAADYLLEHGFCPEQSWKTSVSELVLTLDPEDRFYEDKLDILEFETYDQAPMDPSQSFDVVSVPGRDGEPDPAMVQFVRLCQLGSSDAFLLESIFRKEVWGFMELPVSQVNEGLVVKTIIEACETALKDLAQCPEGGPEICTKLRESETRALTRTFEYLQREQQALDLKEYYQERRLKDLGLDSEWSLDDDIDPDLGVGQTRTPGSADYDW